MKGVFDVCLYDAAGLRDQDVEGALQEGHLELLRHWSCQHNQVFRGLSSFAFANYFGERSNYRTSTGVRPGIVAPFANEAPSTKILFAMLLSTRTDIADDASEAQKARFAWTDPNLNDLGSYVVPGSAKRFDEVATFSASNPPGTLIFEWLYGSGQANGVAHSLEIWGRIDNTEDAQQRECFRVARRLFSEGGVARPFVKTSGQVAAVTWTLTMRALR